MGASLAEWRPVDEPQVVVGAAIWRDGRLLAARRSAPSALAGGWELPGGKVDPGESDEQALLREIAEELGVRIELTARVGTDWPLAPGLVLRVWNARLADPAGDPLPLQDHDELRWLAPSELEAVDWLPGDRAPVRAATSTCQGEHDV
jgi:8-oxo-dGTP diphosphatase